MTNDSGWNCRATEKGKVKKDRSSLEILDIRSWIREMIPCCYQFDANRSSLIWPILAPLLHYQTTHHTDLFVETGMNFSLDRTFCVHHWIWSCVGNVTMYFTLDLIVIIIFSSGHTWASNSVFHSIRLKYWSLPTNWSIWYERVGSIKLGSTHFKSGVICHSAISIILTTTWDNFIQRVHGLTKRVVQKPKNIRWRLLVPEKHKMMAFSAREDFFCRTVTASKLLLGTISI